MAYKIIPSERNRKHTDEAVLEHIQKELSSGLSHYIGERSTSDVVVRINAEAGVLTKEILENAHRRISENSLGSPTVSSMVISKANMDYHVDKNKKYIDENRILKDRIKELEEQVEYYKMLAMEN